MEIPIFHMASFSRSGETLLQRCLNAHPRIEVVHQIREPDSAEDIALFQHLMTRKAQTISIKDPLVAHRKLSENSILLLKNAVWCHSYPRRGFTLVRNPFSIVTSAFRDAPDPEQAERQKRQQFRWAKGIDPLTRGVQGQDPTLTGFMILYARKMLQDRLDGLPFVRYEDFVDAPETVLKKIVSHLGLEWSDRVMRSHEDYSEGQEGHGGIKLWSPIHKGSTDKYKKLSPQTKAQIYGISHEVLRRYGYTWDGVQLGLQDVEGRL